jgi:aspartate 1-decarboxylase
LGKNGDLTRKLLFGSNAKMPTALQNPETIGRETRQEPTFAQPNVLPGCFIRPFFCKGQTMFIEVFKSKIHRVRVTQADLNYIGSITIDEELLEAANLLEGEKVQIVNNNNGERFETYTIRGERGSGVICLNGAAARRVQVGDIVIIISYALMTPEEAKTFRPTAIFPDENNRLVKNEGK